LRRLAALAVIAACAHPTVRARHDVRHGRVIGLFVTAGGAVMTIDRGSDDGVARGWIARFVSLPARPEAPVSSVTRTTSVVQVEATFDQVPAVVDVELRPPR
jgi:hypothetical protein